MRGHSRPGRSGNPGGYTSQWAAPALCSTQKAPCRAQRPIHSDITARSEGLNRGEGWSSSVERMWVWTVPIHSGGPQRAIDSRGLGRETIGLSHIERLQSAHVDRVTLEPPTQTGDELPPAGEARVPQVGETVLRLPGQGPGRLRLGAEPTGLREHQTQARLEHPLRHSRSAVPHRFVTMAHRP